MSQSDARKLASYEVAGGGGANVSVPDGTMERAEISSVPSGRNELWHALPDTPCLANFRLSLQDEAQRRFGRVRMSLDPTQANPSKLYLQPAPPQALHSGATTRSLVFCPCESTA